MNGKEERRSDNMFDNTIEKNIKEENKKAGTLFILILIISGIGGGVIGIFALQASSVLPELSAAFEVFMRENMVIIAIIVPVLMVIMVLFAVIRSRCIIKEARKNAPDFIQTDNEESICKIEKKLSYNLWIISGITIFLYFLFAVIMFADLKFGPRVIPKISIYSVAVFLVSILVLVKLQQKLVDCSKLINPEKKGSVYDLNFSKKWEDSCDESERLIIYRAAFKAYQRVNTACVVLWVVFVILGIFSGVGFLPVVAVIIIWTIMTCTYNYYSIKYSE